MGWAPKFDKCEQDWFELKKTIFFAVGDGEHDGDDNGEHDGDDDGDGVDDLQFD